MLACVRTAAVFGIEASTVDVEVDVSFGLPAFTMVGLPDPSVRGSRDRVRSAIRNSGFDFPEHRITVNLAPADIRKAGSSFDLPIALGVLAASGVVARRNVDDVLLLADVLHIPTTVSLGVIVAIIATAVLLSGWQRRRHARPAARPHDLHTGCARPAPRPDVLETSTRQVATEGGHPDATSAAEATACS